MPLKVVHFDSIDSTSDYAINSLLQKRLDSDYAILADMQTAGRGRLNDRVWVSPRGNFYCSYIVNLANQNIDIGKTNLLCSIVINSLKEFLNNLTGSDIIQVKIPNDILINGKKLAGVLVETYYPYAVIGIGLNLSSSPIERATNLKDAFNIVVKSEEIVENLYNALIVDISKCSYL